MFSRSDLSYSNSSTVVLIFSVSINYDLLPIDHVRDLSICRYSKKPNVQSACDETLSVVYCYHQPCVTPNIAGNTDALNCATTFHFSVGSTGKRRGRPCHLPGATPGEQPTGVCPPVATNGN